MWSLPSLVALNRVVAQHGAREGLRRFTGGVDKDPIVEDKDLTVNPGEVLPVVVEAEAEAA